MRPFEPGSDGVTAIPLANAQEVLYIARRYDRCASGITWIQLMWIYGIIGAFFLFVAVLQHLTKFLNGSYVALLAFVLCIHMAIYLSVFCWKRRPGNEHGLEITNSPRLLCAGKADDLYWVRGFAAGAFDRTFEPAIFRSWFDVHRAQVVLFALLWLPASIVAWGCLQGLGIRLPWFHLIHPFLGIELAGAIAIMMYPTYLRITPGCLEVMRYSGFRRRPLSIARFDLRVSAIGADLNRNVVFIDCESESMTLHIGMMARRRELVQMLFLAAVSTYGTPPLPEDDLLG